MDISLLETGWYGGSQPVRLTPNVRTRYVTRRAIIDVNSIVSGRNYNILTSIIAQVLPSRPLGDLSRPRPLGDFGDRLVRWFSPGTSSVVHQTPKER